MSDRFLVESPIRGNTATLTGQEATHLAKVLRARVGQDIVLFDGSGAEFLARITDIERHAIHCDVLERREIHREAACRVSFGVALPKGDRQKVLVEKLTELGIYAITPLNSDRAVVLAEGQTVERLRRAVIEASKQCGRNRLLVINEPCSASQFFTAADSQALRLIAHPGTDSQKAFSALEVARHSFRDVCIAIGPEGGFTNDEVGQAQNAGWMTISLGPRLLRVETAAIALAAIAAITPQ